MTENDGLTIRRLSVWTDEFDVYVDEYAIRLERVSDRVSTTLHWTESGRAAQARLKREDGSAGSAC